MAKRVESVRRAAWSKAAKITRSSMNPKRAAISQASGADSSEAARTSGSQNVRRMGPYETSYDVQLGYSGRDVV